MRLSLREKILLSIFGILVVAWGYYSFVFTPQYNYLQETQIKMDGLNKTIDDIVLYNDPNGIMQQRYQESEKNIAAATAKYFPEILQEQQIRIVDKMLLGSALKGEVLEFSDLENDVIMERSQQLQSGDATSKEATFILKDLTNKMNPKIAENEQSQDKFSGSGVVESMETNVDFAGTYPQIINFIKAVESYPKKILISSVDIKSGDTAIATTVPGELTGTVTLQFYGIPKMHPDQDQDYTTWDIYDVYGRANPYLP